MKYFFGLVLPLIAGIVLAGCGGSAQKAVSGAESSSPQAVSSAPGSSGGSSTASGAPAALRDSAYRVGWVGYQIPDAMPAGQRECVSVRLQNLGDQTWPSNQINFSYHWFLAEPGSQPKLVDNYDGLRTPLPEDLAPGHDVSLNNACVDTPAQPGPYLLQLTLVQENVTWFENKGAQVQNVTVAIN